MSLAQTNKLTLVLNLKSYASLIHVLNYKELFQNLSKRLQEIVKKNVIVCAPFPMITSMHETGFLCAAQDVSRFSNGPYTGEVVAPLLKEIGVSHAIVGHSERRALFHEDTSCILEKIHQLINAGITPILCVGEASKGECLQKKDLTIFASVAFDIRIAYEPVWAIGTGCIPSVSHISYTHALIDDVLGCNPLYGGSVSGDNIKELLSINPLSGFLVGRASLDMHQLRKMIATLFE